MTIFGKTTFHVFQLLVSCILGWKIAHSGIAYEQFSETIQIVTYSASLMAGQVIWYMFLVGMQSLPIRIMVGTLIGIPFGVIIAFLSFHTLTLL